MTTPLSESIQEAVVRRQVIGQAIGIFMERHQVPRDDAYARLVQASALTSVKLQDIAQKLVDNANSKSRD